MEESRPLLWGHDSNGGSTWPGISTKHQQWRHKTRRFVSSKWGHYIVIALVALDVTGIFLDFLLKLYVCDHTCTKHGTVPDAIPRAIGTLGVISLVFSCLFMLELLANVWAFGLHFFASWFRCLDATVILVGLVIDICLSGVEEEAGSIVVVLRFWRVFKIIEELSTGASEELDDLQARLESARSREIALQAQIDDLRARR